jgi:hypothetical protein
MNIKDVAQRFVPIERPQMAHEKALPVFPKLPELAISMHLYIKLTTVATVEKQVSSGRITNQWSDSVLTKRTHEEQEWKNEQHDPAIPQ